MSGEISLNYEKGLRYGGIPLDEVVKKFEETDPDLIREVSGTDEFDDIEDLAKRYATDLIIDRTPDPPFMESDHARRDHGGFSRSRLNLQYNGTRGSNPELPRHPELFYGFTGDDPRGVTNDPRFDQVRGHFTARAANLEVRMGHNDDNHVAERPWQGQAMSYAMKELHRRVQNNTKIFLTQKEGRPFGRNVVVDGSVGGRPRRAQHAAGGEGLEAAGGRGRFFAGDHGGVAHATGSKARKRYVSAKKAEIAPWRHSSGDTDLAVQQYGQTRNPGRKRIVSQGGRFAVGDQDVADAKVGRAANRQVLGATMALAARAAKGGRRGLNDADHGVSLEGMASGKSATAGDVARVYRNQTEDSERRPAGEVQDDEGGAVRGVPAPSGDHVAAGFGRRQDHDVGESAVLANAEAIARGLKEGSASAKRKIANHVVASGVRVALDAEARPGRTPAPARDPGKAAAKTQAAVVAAAAAQGLEVNAYKSAPPQLEDRTRNRDFGGVPMGRQRENSGPARLGHPEWVSHTQDQTQLSLAQGETFGFDSAPATRGVAGLPNLAVRGRDAGEEMDGRDDSGLSIE